MGLSRIDQGRFAIDGLGFVVVVMAAFIVVVTARVDAAMGPLGIDHWLVASAALWLLLLRLRLVVFALVFFRHDAAMRLLGEDERWLAAFGMGVFYRLVLLVPADGFVQEDGADTDADTYTAATTTTVAAIVVLAGKCRFWTKSDQDEEQRQGCSGCNTLFPEQQTPLHRSLPPGSARPPYSTLGGPNPRISRLVA